MAANPFWDAKWPTPLYWDAAVVHWDGVPIMKPPPHELTRARGASGRCEPRCWRLVRPGVRPGCVALVDGVHRARPGSAVLVDGGWSSRRWMVSKGGARHDGRGRGVETGSARHDGDDVRRHCGGRSCAGRCWRRRGLRFRLSPRVWEGALTACVPLVRGHRGWSRIHGGRPRT